MTPLSDRIIRKRIEKALKHIVVRTGLSRDEVLVHLLGGKVVSKGGYRTRLPIGMSYAPFAEEILKRAARTRNWDNIRSLLKSVTGEKVGILPWNLMELREYTAEVLSALPERNGALIRRNDIKLEWSKLMKRYGRSIEELKGQMSKIVDEHCKSISPRLQVDDRGHTGRGDTGRGDIDLLHWGEFLRAVEAVHCCPIPWEGLKLEEIGALCSWVKTKRVTWSVKWRLLSWQMAKASFGWETMNVVRAMLLVMYRKTTRLRRSGDREIVIPIYEINEACWRVTTMLAPYCIYHYLFGSCSISKFPGRTMDSDSWVKLLRAEVRRREVRIHKAEDFAILRRGRFALQESWVWSSNGRVSSESECDLVLEV